MGPSWDERNSIMDHLVEEQCKALTGKPAPFAGDARLVDILTAGAVAFYALKEGNPEKALEAFDGVVSWAVR